MEPKLESYKRSALSQLAKEHRMSFSFTTFDSLHSDLTYYVLSRVLGMYQLTYLSEVLMVFIKEVVNNAVKANLKRVFFQERGAKIDDEKHSQDIMAAFRESGINHIKEYTAALKKDKLKVSLYLLTKPDGFHFMIANNTSMTSREFARVLRSFRKAKETDNLFEVMDIDSSASAEAEKEGAGLGLIMNLLLLKKMGIDPNNFKIETKNGVTWAKLYVPKNIARPEIVKYVYDKIENKLENIPTFPERTQKIMQLCDDGDSSLRQITQEIERDPSLCANLLRTANSVAFYAARSSSGKRVDSISRTITVLGLKGIKQLVAYHTTSVIMHKYFEVYQAFQEHSEKCALYSFLIAQHTDNKKISDTVYLAGLLHDIGKIVLQSIDPAIIKKINGVNTDRTVNSTAVIEEMSLGISHTKVGARLAKKWRFAESVIQVVGCHHAPFAADKKYLKEVSIIHLADAFINIEKGHKNYNYLDIEAQASIGIFSPEDLEKLHLKIKEDYKREQKNSSVA